MGLNGRPWPELAVDAARYRFRLINASNARRYRLALDPPPPEGPAFVQIGSDGGLLETPLDQDAIQLAPAERFDVIVDFSGYPVGTAVTLTNALGIGSTDAVMRFRVARRVGDDSHVPAGWPSSSRWSRPPARPSANGASPAAPGAPRPG